MVEETGDERPGPPETEFWGIEPGEKQHVSIDEIDELADLDEESEGA